MEGNRWRFIVLPVAVISLIALVLTGLVFRSPPETDVTAADESAVSLSTTSDSSKSSQDSTRNQEPVSSQKPIADPAGAVAGIRKGQSVTLFRQDNPMYSEYATVAQSDLPIEQLRVDSQSSNGPQPTEGQFRTTCQVSHVSDDDPIIFPDKPGQAHRHVFFGNTAVDAFTTTETLINSGGGSCDGQELNRTGYWMPALYEGEEMRLPTSIIVYYKSKDFSKVVPMPSGLKMVTGNVTQRAGFSNSNNMFWSCGGSGASENRTNQLPDCSANGTLNATIAFPQCWDGQNLDSTDHQSHMMLVSEEDSCPASHPVRFPQVRVLAYWNNAATFNHTDLYLSSDRHNGHDGAPGSTLHADWWGGWHPDVISEWTSNCINSPHNCSEGQTGTPRKLRPVPKQ